jgi:hypothetical protein
MYIVNTKARTVGGSVPKEKLSEESRQSSIAKEALGGLRAERQVQRPEALRPILEQCSTVYFNRFLISSTILLSGTVS